MGNMSDFEIVEVDTFDVGTLELLPDTLMALSGASFGDMLPTVSKKGAKTQMNSGYAPSIHFSEEDIAGNPILALTPIQYRTLRLHMQGWKPQQIAQYFGITEVAVNTRLRQKRVQAAKLHLLEELDEEMSGLMGTALDAYRDVVGPGNDKKLRLAAADRIFRLNGKGLAKAQDKSKDGDMSAAQFMKSLLENIETTINVDVNTRPADPRSITGSAEAKPLDGDVRGFSDAADVEDCQ
jgi:hypothetical protein